MNTFTEIALIGIFFLMLLLHTGILFKWISYSFIWGGRIKTDKEMVRFEIISIMLNVIFLWVALTRAQLVKNLFPETYLAIVLWCMAVFFLINLIANLFSENKIERFLFSPIALCIAILCITLAMS